MAFSRRMMVAVMAVSVLGLGGGITASAAGGDSTAADANAATASPGELWKRTELFFGTGKPDGSEVSDVEFAKFSERQITPAFPDGFTELDGKGQYRSASGVIVREHSHVVIVLYPLTDRAANGEIEAIRAEYKREFLQESVLRTDTLEKVSF